MGSSGKFEEAQFPGSNEDLDFLELRKSRLLENESALQFLRSLGPRIVGESLYFFEPHTLFLALS